MTINTWAFETAVRTLWQEARSEPLIGQEAVAHVIWNRVRHGRWGKNLASVCLWHLQFSGWRSVDPNFYPACALPDDSPALASLRTVLAAAETAPDFTNGAMFYYAPLGVQHVPSWTTQMEFCGDFGSQKFYKEKA